MIPGMAATMAGAGAPGPASGQSAGPGADPRLKPAAHEFEACLLKEFLEPMQKNTLFDDSKDGDTGEGSGNALMSFGSEALARAISDRGGFGIATKIIGHLGTGDPGRGAKGNF
jgi:Rod binding domain-containing protein